MNSEKYYLRLAAAFVRGRCAQGTSVALTKAQQNGQLSRLTDADLAVIVEAGRSAGLKLHKFKRTMGLARVKRVFGGIRALAPQDVLDVGSGRGAFLWPLLDEFTELSVTAIDQSRQRADDLEAVRIGGIDRLTSHQMDVTNLSFGDDTFDVATMLEVLEHIPNLQQALSEVVRVTRRFVVVSVPSKPDDNPQHIHFFSESDLRGCFNRCGVERVSVDYVPGHMIVMANVER